MYQFEYIYFLNISKKYEILIYIYFIEIIVRQREPIIKIYVAVKMFKT